jgi:hypothetical protein
MRRSIIAHDIRLYGHQWVEAIHQLVAESQVYAGENVRSYPATAVGDRPNASANSCRPTPVRIEARTSGGIGASHRAPCSRS